MIQGQTDPETSPAGSTGILSEPLELPPKPDVLGEQNGNISKTPLTHLQDRIEVETDAVASPPRPRDSKTSEELEHSGQTGKNLNCHSTSPPQSEIQKEKSDQTESREVPGFSTRRQRDKPNPNREPRSSTVININNSTGFVIGSVITIPTRGYNTQFEEDGDKKRKKREKYYSKLLSCQDELLEEDLIIVSESLEERGLRSLLQELPMDEREAGEIKREFEWKGQSEVIFQILSRWKCLMSELSSKLLQEEVYNNGGRKALKGLLENHFQTID